MCRQDRWDFSDLRAIFVNSNLKRSPEVSNTEGLAGISMEIMRRNGIIVEAVRADDHEIQVGVWPDMTEHGWAAENWPVIFARVMARTSSCCASPTWRGEKSSVCTKVIERLYANSSQVNAAGQYAYYGKVGGCLVTGNKAG